MRLCSKLPWTRLKWLDLRSINRVGATERNEHGVDVGDASMLTDSNKFHY